MAVTCHPSQRFARTGGQAYILPPPRGTVFDPEFLYKVNVDDDRTLSALEATRQELRDFHNEVVSLFYDTLPWPICPAVKKLAAAAATVVAAAAAVAVPLDVDIPSRGEGRCSFMPMV